VLKVRERVVSLAFDEQAEIAPRMCMNGMMGTSARAGYSPPRKNANHETTPGTRM
jgi:hypothetical protein